MAHSDQDFDLLVRNVYKVLLTRGLRGVHLHSTDAETQRFLERLINRGAGHPGIPSRALR